MSFISLSKKNSKFFQIIFLISCLISLIECQETHNSKYIKYIGYGIWAIIVALAIGIILMIFGLATNIPGIFVFIGMALPVIVGIFVFFCPKTDDSGEKEEDMRKNYYIIARWMHFLVLLIFFILLIVPAFMKWNINIIPQRVYSISESDIFDEKYLEAIEKQKKRKYNLEETEVLFPSLSINKSRKKLIRNNNRIDSDLKNNDTTIKSNNIDENIIDEDKKDDAPSSILPKVSTKKNELNENRKKFKVFKRLNEKK